MRPFRVLPERLFCEDCHQNFTPSNYSHIVTGRCGACNAARRICATAQEGNCMDPQEYISAYFWAHDCRRAELIKYLFPDSPTEYTDQWADRGSFEFWHHLDANNQKRALVVIRELWLKAMRTEGNL